MPRFLLLGFWLLTGAAFGAISLSLDSLRHPLFQIQGLQLVLDGQGGQLSIRGLQALGRSWQRLKLVCGRLSLAPGQFQCEQGRLVLPGASIPAIPMVLRQQDDVWSLELRPGGSERWLFQYGPEGHVNLDIQQGSLSLLQALFPELKRAGLVGQLSGELKYDGKKIETRLNLVRGGFSSPDGRQAGEGLQSGLVLAARERVGGWQVDGSLDWQGGAIYAEPLYLQASRQSMQFRGQLNSEAWSLEQVQLSWPQVGQFEGQGAGSWKAGLRTARLSARDLALQPLGKALLNPLLEARGWPPLQLAGRTDATLAWDQGRLSSFGLALQDAGLMLEDGRFVVGGINGVLPWNNAAPVTGQLDFAHLSLGRLKSGAFHLPLQIHPRGFALAAPLSIPFLDSELVVDHLRAGLSAADGPWEGAMGLSLYPVALGELTQLLDLPPMGGLLSANLPSIHYQDGTASLDGALVIQVFDGYLNCTDLRLIDPFGPLPRILADVEARHLDLGQLTQTFSFGQMTGFIDAQVQGLEIANWRPLAFNARVESSPGEYPRRISQKAVADITALGGGGAMAAVQSSFLRFFQDFGYRRIGLSCHLENGVCRMAGIPGLDRNGAYAIVEGGGIPALTVIGYNRNVHWEELISRLQTAISNPSRPVIK